MPVYNGARWIEGSLRSALAQSFRDLEILIVDDGSTDDTLACAQRIDDPRVRIVRNQSSRGLPGNWNRCLELAAGKYVKFLFQDDLLKPTCVEKMVELAESAPTVGVIFSLREVELIEPISADGLRWKETYGVLHESLLPLGRVNSGRELLRRAARRDLAQNQMGEPSVVMFRRSCFDAIGHFDPRIYQLCDWDMCVRMMTRYDVGFVDEVLSVFRYHAASATSANKAKNRDRFDAISLKKNLFVTKLDQLLRGQLLR